MSKKMRERPVVVTTVHRGVFFGYATDTRGKTITLNRARLCVYWSEDMKGFMGLADTGPSSSCRIGPAADITVHGVTSVVEVTPHAERALGWKGQGGYGCMGHGGRGRANAARETVWFSPHCLRPGLPFHERWDDGVDTGGVIGGAQSEVS